MQTRRGNDARGCTTASDLELRAAYTAIGERGHAGTCGADDRVWLAGTRALKMADHDGTNALSAATAWRGERYRNVSHRRPNGRKSITRSLVDGPERGRSVGRLVGNACRKRARARLRPTDGATRFAQHSDGDVFGGS